MLFRSSEILEKKICPPDLKKGIYSNYTKLVCRNYLCRGRQEALATKVFKNSCDLYGRAKSFIPGLTDKVAIQLIPENGTWLDVFEADSEKIKMCTTPSGAFIIKSLVPKLEESIKSAKNNINFALVLAGSGIERLSAKRSLLLSERFVTEIGRAHV